ncbi:hypothetical protein FVEN_g1669 [Fusarium venenatum]|uniref:Uncharacterized protein n=1 Tax=Fusarium venenatum TaxID=56646 RepID=A0A2L2T515_9HYPO|nr:uncharacterized protein FVRRES_13100 [Fusarium venenatum]KAG8360996.1 hypothetical protein FVEN_g1669 [Fusarium venenatum]KAH6979664.1 hypothetical protein EDB82DRAFT_264521 [Fusarium venenatum]CEI40410.1 unnamed protein product [Fusarium venenatum]
MGGKTSKALCQEPFEESAKNNQKEIKADFSQGPAKDVWSKSLPLRLSKKRPSQHAPTQQRDKCEEKAGEEEAEPEPSERSLQESREVNSQTNPTSNGSSAGSPFHNDDVNAGIVILTLITDICKKARKPSDQEQEQLHAVFDQMPYLLTSEAREQQREEELVMAIQFLTTVYDHPESVNWGAIESFDNLQLALESLKKFGDRVEAEPREGPGGVFIV